MDTESIGNLVEQLGSGDQAQGYKAYLELFNRAASAGAPGNESARSELARELAAELNAEVEDGDSKRQKHSAKVRGLVARVLALVGGDEQVPAVKQTLGDFHAREMGRWSLDRIPGEAATSALIVAAVEGIGPEYRIGAINALGKRQGDATVAALKQCAEDGDLEVRLAAVEALSNQTEPEADASFASLLAESHLPERARGRAIKARIRLAETLARAGQTSAAKSVYEAVLAGKPDDPQRAAAQRGLAGLA